jgi:NAD(P)-dependent dehydrogenase (short-subunit alcohol dehydrogenase family)
MIAAVELARAFELRVTAQGTGHNAAPLGPLEDTVLVKTEPMRGIEIDPEARIARVAEIHELSDVITFLATPAAGYINGAAIHVDGGRIAV